MKLREVFIGAVILLLLFAVAGRAYRGDSALEVDFRGGWRLSAESSPKPDAGRAGQVFILGREKSEDYKWEGPTAPSKFYQGANFFDLLMSERSLF
jgi:preprotein translocase subunit SecF